MRAQIYLWVRMNEKFIIPLNGLTAGKNEFFLHAGKEFFDSFENTEILEEYMYDKYDCYFFDATDFWERNVERKFVDSEYITWNPVVFDTWDEYIDLIKDKEYAVYFESVEASENLSAEELYLPIWEQMEKDNKREFINNSRCKHENLYLPQIAGHIESEFSNILDKYGLWYEPQFAWSLSCFRN